MFFYTLREIVVRQVMFLKNLKIVSYVTSLFLLLILNTMFKDGVEKFFKYINVCAKDFCSPLYTMRICKNFSKPCL